MSRPHNWMRVASLTTTPGIYPGGRSFASSWNDSDLGAILATLHVVQLVQLEERLRGAGLRVTAPRVAVLRVLSEASDHPRVDQVIERVRAGGLSISTQAAYDVCEALRENGLARRISPAGGPARWEARAGDNHHHLVCRSCGATVDVDCVTGAAPCLDAPVAKGFVVDEAEVTFWGSCPTCQSQGEPNE
jgi:Fe2+ or Zn2+ uptake regulation protein